MLSFDMDEERDTTNVCFIWLLMLQAVHKLAPFGRHDIQYNDTSLRDSA
jgi:hypothetical protein